MIDAKRRLLLKGSLGAGAVGVAVGAGLLSPPRRARQLARGRLQGHRHRNRADRPARQRQATETSDAVKIKAPDIAENGAVVPVTVEGDIEGAKSIAIIATGNGTPLIASFDLGENALPFVSTRIKMAKTADVMAVVRTDSGLLSNAKSVKVTIGGCGG
jgi:sulfur-oxidizing protein SoxY